MAVKLQFGRLSILHKGNYNISLNYEKLDVVSYGGNSYICIKDNIGILPTNTEYWRLMAKSGEDGKSAYEIYRETITHNKEFIIVDHTNFADARHNQLEDYYNNYPVEAQQDGETWPAFYPPAFPWLVVNHAFDGNIVLKIFFRGEEVMSYIPTAKVEAESGELVDRTYAIIGIPSIGPSFAQYAETSGGTDILTNKDDFKVVITDNNMSEEEWVNSLKGIDGINGLDGQDGKSAYDLYVDQNTTVCNTWLVVDHRNFAEARHNQLEDYYNNYPAEAQQDGETWPPFTASKFPWLVVNYNFDGNTTANFYYKDELKLSWKPSAKVEQESGNFVDRTYGILSIPEEFNIPEFTETIEGTDVFVDPNDIRVELTTALSLNDWLESLKGKDGSIGAAGLDGKSAYELYVSTVPAGLTPMTIEEWLASLKGDTIDISILNNYATTEYVNNKFDDVLGVNADGISALKALAEDSSAATGLLKVIGEKADSSTVYTKSLVDLILQDISINGVVGQDGKSAYDLYVEQNTTVCNTWLVVDHRNFAEARHNQLEDYYNNYPVEASQDGETWPPFTASKFPWLVVNYNFNGKTTANFYYKNDLKLSWTPSEKVEQESGNLVDRTYGILSIPEEFNIPEFTETVEGTDIFIDPNDIRVELSTALSLNDWLESLKGSDGIDGINGKSAYEIAVDNGFSGDISAWVDSLKGTNGIDGHDGVDGINGIDGIDGKSAYELYLESNTTLSNSWLIVDHTNFADARHNQLEDYYNNYPVEAQQDGETWPAWTPSAFPWIVVNHNFDGNTTLIVKYLGEEVFRTLPSAEVEQESGNMVQRTYSIWSLPNNLGLTQFTETSQGTAVLANPADFRVELISNYMNQSEWLDSLKGINGIDGTNGINGKSAYELAVENGYEGNINEWLDSLKGTDGINGVDGSNGINGKSAYEIYVDNVSAGDPVLTESEWLESLVAKADMSNVYTKDEVNQKFTDLVGSAPEAFDTLKEISDELTNSSTAITTIINTLTHKVDSSVVYTKQEIDASIVAYAQPKGEYLTEHQDLSLLATKFEVSTGYYNKHEIELMITATGTFTPELYYTKTDINEKLINDTSNFITQNDASIYLTEHQSLEDYDNSIASLNSSINTIEELLTGIDSSWNGYYTKNEIDDIVETLNVSINIADSSIIRIDETIDNIQGAVENADSSIEYIRGQLANIDSSWENYLTVETFNNLVEADADETINKFNEIVDFLAGIDTTDEVLYNKLFSINASINDISTRLHNIDSSWNNYYTKEEIDDTIEAVNASISNSDSSITIINEKLQNIDSSWDNYYNKEAIDVSIVAYALPKGDYALNTDISAKYYTKTLVDDIISESDIFNAELYYTKDDIDNSHFLVANDVSNKLEANDISTKADKSELFSGSYEDLTDKPNIPEKVSDLTNDAEYTTISDLSTAIANLVNSAPETLDTLGEVAEALNNADTSIIAILDTIGNKANKEDVYTKTQIDASIIEYALPKGEYLTNTDLEGYVENSSITENYVSKNDASIYLTEHQPLDEYAKKADISAFLAANDISTKADKSELPTKVSELENDSSYLTATDVSQFLTEHQSLDEYAKIADVDSSLSNIKDSIENADASIIAINTHLENIDSSWQNYYSKEELNANNDIINASVNNADASIESIKQQLLAIDSSWQNYLTVETFNDLVEADADGTINKFNEIVDFLAGIDTADDTLYNTLYSINASINDISSRLHNIDSSWAYYYTKDEIDNNHFLVANDVSNFLTEHQSLDEYAKIADADASIAELKESIENADASISNITTRIDDIDSSWYNYYSKEELNSTIDNINDAISRADTSIAEIKESLSSNQNYYSTDEIDSIIGTLNASISNTDASIININTHFNNIDSSWQNYYDKTAIDASIIEYAQPKGEYLIANDISTKADKSELPTKVSDLLNDSEYVTNASMNARFTELIGAAPEAYDTLKEIADKLGDDDASLGTLFNMLADKSDVSTTYTKDQVDTLLTENYLTNTEVSTLLQDYALNASINTIFNTNDSNVDLEIADPSGNTLVAFYGGHMRTKYFDSAAVNSSIDGLIDTINSGALLPTIGEDPSSNDPNDIYWFIAGQKTEYRATPKIINISASDYQALSEKDETAIYVITDAFNNINGNNIEYTIGNISSTSNINDLDVSIHKNDNVVSFDFTLPIANIDMSNLTEQQLALLQGKSNYDIYVENHDSAIDGSLLSEAEWLATLKGTTGDDGKSAYQLYVDAYEIANGDTTGVMTLAEWLNSLTPQINADASNNLYWYINGNKSQYKAFPEIRYITAAEYDALTDTDDSIIYIITSSQDASALSFNVGTVTTTDIDTDVSVNIRRVNSSVYFDFVLPFSVDSSKYRGKSAYQSYLDTLPSGTEPMTEANWVNSLRGKSAYELFLEANPTTPYDTSAKWFASLKGADGSTGPVGPQGPATDVSIDSDGYWVINGMVTNKSAKGIVPNISIGIYRNTNTNEDVALNTWWIDGIDTHIPTSQGVDINTLESRLGQLGNKVNAVPATYYTAEEAAAYNTEHELSSGDPGYVSEGDLKTAAIPAVPYTVKDYVDDHQPNIDTSNLYTKSEVDQLFADLIGSAPATLDTLKEIADKLSADDTSLGELHTILSNKCDTSTTYTKTLVDTLLQSYVTTEYFNEHNTSGSGSIDASALADYALKTYVDSKIGTLPNKTDDVYYTQEECDIYNTSNNLTSEDEGFLTTSIIKDPSTQYTDIVDAIEETEEVIAAMLINFNNSINDISSRVATLSATPTPAIWVGTQSEYNLLDPISETTIYIIKADTSLS